MPLKVGVFVDGFRMPWQDGLKVAAGMKVDCFQIYLTAGDMLAANMGPLARRNFVQVYQGLGLKLSATCGDFGGMDFGDNEKLAQVEPKLKDAVIQTFELGAAIMTTHVGAVHDDPEKEKVMVENLRRLGEFAFAHGVTLATETGPEPGSRLRSILDRAGTKGVAVNFDPANLVMRGYDHMQSARDLAPYIVHTHAKDGRRVNGTGQEVPLGEGNVKFPAYVRLLTELGYRGPYVIEREVGPDPVADIRRAVDFLRNL